MGNNRILNVANPTNDTDAVNKIYVDITTNSTFVFKTGDIMTGDLILHTGADVSRMLGDDDLPNNRTFSLILGNNQNQIKYQRIDSSLQPITMMSDNGFLVQMNNNNIIRFGIDNSNKQIVTYQVLQLGAGLDANVHNIYNLADPVSNNDAATKKYVDNKLRKCHVGYIPIIHSNTGKTGFIASSSSNFNNNYIAANAFNDVYANGGGSGGEWCTNGVTSNFWIKIQCPESVRTWKIGLRGRDNNVEQIYNWRFEGSTDDVTYTPLLIQANTYLSNVNVEQIYNWRSEESTDDVTYTPLLNQTKVYISNIYQEFLVDSIVVYKYFRFYGINGGASNPGLSKFQIFVYSD